MATRALGRSLVRRGLRAVNVTRRYARTSRELVDSKSSRSTVSTPLRRIVTTAGTYSAGGLPAVAGMVGVKAAKAGFKAGRRAFARSRRGGIFLGRTMRRVVPARARDPLARLMRRKMRTQRRYALGRKATRYDRLVDDRQFSMGKGIEPTRIHRAFLARRTRIRRAEGRVRKITDRWRGKTAASRYRAAKKLSLTSPTRQLDHSTRKLDRRIMAYLGQ